VDRPEEFRPFRLYAGPGVAAGEMIVDQAE
jgi:hypothetical protein